MAVRQYIGARYVPRFVGLYDVTQSYEALDVVDNGSGTSYIAKKPTPAGTPLTDTNYWFLYGSTNGAIVNLQQQINDMKDGSVPGSLQDQINDNASDITALANKTNLFDSGANVMYIGDSWSVGGIPTHLNNMIGFNSFYSNMYGGSGFVATGDAPATDKTFEKLLTDLCSTLTSAELSAINYLVVVGDVNDATPTYLPQISDALRHFIDTAKTLLPNAKIYVFAANHTINGLWSRFNYIDELMKRQGYKNCIISDVTWAMGVDEWINTAHLNSAGYLKVAYAIACAMRGVPYGAGQSFKTVTAVSQDDNTLTFQLTFYKLNKKFYLYTNGFNKTGLSINATYISHMKFTLSDAKVPFYEGESILVPAMIYRSGDTYKESAAFQLTFNGGDEIEITIPGLGGTITELYIRGGEYNMQA